MPKIYGTIGSFTATGGLVMLKPVAGPVAFCHMLFATTAHTDEHGKADAVLNAKAQV